MRVSNQLLFANFTQDYRKSMNELFNINKDISSGRQIQNSFDGSSMYSDIIRLENEEQTLEQVSESAQKALNFSNNTDSTLNQFQSGLDKFKQKLIQAASAVHSNTSMNAIADELEKIKEHLVSLANTSINGQYLFSGTAINTKPIDNNGEYRGNDRVMKSLVGSGVEIQYNLDGKNLFYGSDNDYNKSITTNVKMLNQVLLHPLQNIDDATVANISEEKYLTTEDSIREMIGDTDADSTNDPTLYLYISGKDTSGVAFQKRISFDDTSAPLQDMLDRIGEAFGNTNYNKVVEVTMNNHGQIEIKDLKNGNNQIDFHLVGAVDRSGNNNAKQDNINSLLSQKNVQIINFIESGFGYVKITDKVSTTQNIYNDKEFELKGRFAKPNGEAALIGEKLSDIFPENSSGTIDIEIEKDGTTISTSVNINNTNTLNDLFNEIENSYNTNGDTDKTIKIVYDDGVLRIEGNGNNKDYDDFSLSLSSSNGSKSFSGLDGFVNDKSYFSKKGDRLTSNISQIIKIYDSLGDIKEDKNSYATENTKLVEVAGIKNDGSSTLENTSLNMEFIDIFGNIKKGIVELNDDSLFRIDDDNDGTYDRTYHILDISGNHTKADEVTYKQLNDVISMMITNDLPAADDDIDEYNKALETSRVKADVGLNDKGQINIKDKLNSASKIEFSIYDSNSGNFTKDNAPLLTFNSNNLLTIDEPNIDFFKDLDKMIEDVRNGVYRADSNSPKKRSLGIQNAIARLDHLSDHIEKQHTKIGSLSNALSSAYERNQTLLINTTKVRSELSDTDFGEALMNYQQISTAYQAMLATASKINKMSLLNYI